MKDSLILLICSLTAGIWWGFLFILGLPLILFGLRKPALIRNFYDHFHAGTTMLDLGCGSGTRGKETADLYKS